MKRTLGVCYYPEQWPESDWAKDAARMAELGLTWVRIGEFAWSRLEPAPGDLRFEWLDRAIAVLGAAGLRVVLGTPTATPPRWMLDRHPDMLATDAEGRPRGFGSRRHYCFSHDGYRNESARITQLLAQRYGANPHIAAWQTDNEYGCHDTILSYSEAARAAFQLWCAVRYGTIDALNTAWGTVFWSMEYQRFDQIGLPNLTVTEAHPAHVMAFRQFSSDQVARFNAVQVDLIRQHSAAPISHNYMGRITQFDHFETGRQMEIATWDSYPLGFLEDRLETDTEHTRRYARQGDPDFQAFHHDLYRAVGRGRWWVMEQQPGPVNWAPYNPAPLDGMVRLWTWEAFAHGAEAVCYFRWRQAPKAQEQMHSGLLRPDSEPAPGFDEAARVAAELKSMPDVAAAPAPVALVFDYAAAWAFDTQPQGRDLDYVWTVFQTYRALRQLGQSVDILPPDTADLSGYALVLAPGLVTAHPAFLIALTTLTGTAILGPRFNARTADFAIPLPLPPNIPGLDVQVARIETPRPDMPIAVKGGGNVIRWSETLIGTCVPVYTAEAGSPVMVRDGAVCYLGGMPDEVLWERILSDALSAQGVPITQMPEGVRQRHTGAGRFVLNYGPEAATFDQFTLPAAGVLWLADDGHAALLGDG